MTFPQVTIPIFFNAWRFEKEEHIILPLFETLLNTLEKYEHSPIDKAKKISKSTIQHVKNIVTSLPYGLNISSAVKTVKGFVSGDVEDLAEAVNIVNVDIAKQKAKEKTDDEQVGSQTIQELLKPEELRSIYLNIPQWIEKITLFENVNFVFLIDDLDRCLPENTLKMLESIKLFLDVPSCAFVLAVDDDVVERGVVHHYRDYLSIYHHKDTEDTKGVMQHELPITGHEYLEKMIQLPIRLPVIDTVNVREFLEEYSQGWIELIDTTNHTDDLKDISEFNNESTLEDKFYLSPCSDLLDFLSKVIPPKPRKIKRTAKLFETKLRLLEINGLLHKVDYMFVAKLTLLELFAPKLLRFIQNQGYGRIFNTLCYFREVGYSGQREDELEHEMAGDPIKPMDPYLNSLLDIKLIKKYINRPGEDEDRQGYTTKEKKTFLKLMNIIEEHYNSRIIFDLDVIFDKKYDNDKLKIILELKEEYKVINFEENQKHFNTDFYKRLFRAGDVDGWSGALSDYNALINKEQLDELIKKGQEEIDKTFNNLPFIVNPEWVGQIAKFVDNESYKRLLQASHDARFKSFDDTNKKKQIDMFQLTFAEYDKYCDVKNIEKPRDEGWGRGRRSVIYVSWNDAMKYIEWLNTFLDARYALPTEEEWELSCNNGKELINDKPDWYFGDDVNKIEKYAWYDENSENKIHHVGEKKPNSLGLYDMHGNVWEWCENWYPDNKKKGKVLSGGSWFSDIIYTCTASHIFNTPTVRFNVVGFRLLRILL